MKKIINNDIMRINPKTKKKEYGTKEITLTVETPTAKNMLNAKEVLYKNSILPIRGARGGHNYRTGKPRAERTYEIGNFDPMGLAAMKKQGIMVITNKTIKENWGKGSINGQ